MSGRGDVKNDDSKRRRGRKDPEPTGPQTFQPVTEDDLSAVDEVADEVFTLNQEPTAYVFHFHNENRDHEYMELELVAVVCDAKGKILATCNNETPDVLNGGMTLIRQVITGEGDSQEGKEQPMIRLEPEMLPVDARTCYFAVCSFGDESAPVHLKNVREAELHVSATHDREAVVAEYECNPFLMHMVEIRKKEKAIAAQEKAEKESEKNGNASNNTARDKAARTRPSRTPNRNISRRKEREDPPKSSLPATTVQDPNSGDAASVEVEELAITSLVWACLARDSKSPFLWKLQSVKRTFQYETSEELSTQISSLASSYAATFPLTGVSLADLKLQTTSLMAPFSPSRWLTPEENTVLRMDMLQLQIRHNLPSLAFWGKIFGQKADYLIVVSQTMDTQIRRTFYYSVSGSGSGLHRFPYVDDWARRQASLINRNTYFTGRPKYVYKDPTLSQNEDDIEEDDELEEELQDTGVRGLLEVERLSITLGMIDNLVCVAPRGKYLLDVCDCYITNPHFRGLSPVDAMKLSSYVLLRPPNQEETLKVVATERLVDRSDVFDDLSRFELKGTWALQRSADKQYVLLRSFVCPGYEFHLRPGSTECCGIYIGHGIVPDGIAFMIPTL